MKNVKEVAAAFLTVVGFYYLLHLLHVGCPIKFLTGISCAGCGMTRAWGALLSFRIDEAFYYHPLFWIPPVFVLVYYFRSKINKRLYKILIFTIIVSFGTIYLIRLFCGESEIVVWRPEKGFIYKILQVIFRRGKNVL